MDVPARDMRRQAIRQAILADEDETVARLSREAGLTPEDRRAVEEKAAELVRAVRGSDDPGLMEEFLGEYGLSTQEGVALMCLAEALLRVPDAPTMDALIQDKIAPHDWSSHLGKSDSTLVNASTWALMLTGRVVDPDARPGVVGTLRGLVQRLGEPVIRKATQRAMREMGAQFVLGRDIAEAMENGRPSREKGYTYSYDMLGEAARTDADARRYHDAYAQAIRAIAANADSESVRDNPGISVKLSALHPRYEFGQREAMMPILVERTLELARMAAEAGLGFNLDAEEQDRLDLSLDVVEAALADPALDGWEGFGLVVQAYGPRAAPVIDWLGERATEAGRRLMVRLVKGAYWDTEIKRAQVEGLDGFPVFTRKAHTDVSFMACARKLLDRRDRIYPQFATHNAHTAAAVLHMAGNERDSFEFQRLHGMGEALHDAVMREAGTRCRIYAPVGAHRDLLAYLVRRLLENGANSSFVHQIVDEDVPAEVIARDPLATMEEATGATVTRGPSLYGARRNSAGLDLTDPVEVAAFEAARAPFAAPHRWGEGAGREIRNPARPDEVVGHVRDVDADGVAEAIGAALEAAPAWAARPAAERAEALRRAADLYERHSGELFALATREAGKSPKDCVAELREAVDFLRYYAHGAEATVRRGEARGVIGCISPWNFPLAIFTGQVAAALAAGNAVVAKPAESTCLIAAKAVSLLHEAGVPEDALRLVPGDGEAGAALSSDPRIGGIAFTGSTATAKAIDRALAEHAAPDAMLIAETGGLNAMIVDSTALPEQAVRDLIASAFQSAGQRCSAARMLYVQRDVAEGLLEMVRGAMDALVVGDPWDIATDVGPVIDAQAKQRIEAHVSALEGDLIHRVDAPEEGHFVAPAMIRVPGIAAMEEEVFGPVLHVATYEADALDAVLADIEATGYGLTMGLHTRIDARVQQVIDAAKVGNLYVNRNQIGAIVGSQPFGGEGLSGTGPKAGGPHYLDRFRRGEGGAGAPGGETLLSADVRGALGALNGDEWASRGDRIGTLRRALRGAASEAMTAAAALDHGPIDLPGPTGESNRLALAPKGVALCLGFGAEAALDQAVQALAGGNAALVIAEGARKATARLREAGLPVAALDGRIDPKLLETLAVDAVAATGTAEALRPIRRALAAREGALLPLIAERLAPERYMHERAVCIDTTAAGGNAALLAEVAANEAA